MMRIILILTVLFHTGFLFSEQATNQKPNILFIMLDDLGKEWISCYGAEDIETPNIDALVAGGMKFNNAYSMPQCTPSRATLLTGKYPFRNGYVNHWDVPRWGIGYFDWKHKENTTFARLMKDLGYATFAAGKWQINDFRIEPQAMKKHGFDDWAMWTGFETGNPASAERYQDPYINTPAGSKTYKGKFGTDVFLDHMFKFMKKHKKDPMCIYFPMALPHTPLVTTPDEPKVSSKLGRHKAMVRYMDKSVGLIVEELDSQGIRDNTILIFTTDNGSTPSITGTRNGKKLNGGKSKEIEAGVCAPFIVNCPGKVPAGVVTEALTDFSDLLPTFIELGSGQLPDDLVVDGLSIAPVILGKENDSKRKWIMALGFGKAKIDQNGFKPRDPFITRVIRDKKFKVWVSKDKKMVRLHDLTEDPWEEINLIESKKEEHSMARGKFSKILFSLPDEDARPLYTPRANNPWDIRK